MDTVVLKIGGRAAEDAEGLRQLCGELGGMGGARASAGGAGRRFIIVHGGGAEVTAVSRKLGIEAVFRDGIRQTSPAEMDIVDMVLAGKMNKQIVRLCRTCGLDAVGISGSDGGSCVGTAVGGGDSRTGELSGVRRRLLDTLLDAGFLPVVAPACMDSSGRGLNINADSVAFGIARELPAAALVFLSDMPGVLRDGQVIPELAAGGVGALVAAGVISGGMIPKVSASLDAISHGVRTVIIGRYDGPGSLDRLLAGTAGTRITS